MVSKNECVTDNEIIKTARLNGSKWPNNKGDKANNEVATKLTCIPGVRPVIMPIITPRATTINISINIDKAVI